MMGTRKATLTRRPLRSVRSLVAASTVAAASIGAYTINAPSAFAAPPGLNAPGRVYPAVNTLMAFSGTDGVSGDNRVISVSGMVNGPLGCNPNAGNGYDIDDCPRVQIDLNTSFGAGLLRIPGNTAITDLDGSPDVDIILAASGAVIDNATDPNGGDSLLFHINGTETQLNDTLGDLQFVPAPGYEEKESADGVLPNLKIQAIQGNGVDNVTKYTYIKVEGTNTGPAFGAPAAPQNASAGATNDYVDLVSVVDNEMCNLAKCGAPFSNPGKAEGDDQMLVVAWLAESSCGTFSLRGGAFTTMGSGSLSSVHSLLTTGQGLTTDQALPIELSISPTALALDLSAQTGGPLNDTTVFAGLGDISEVRYALSLIHFNAPASDTTCHMNLTVSDLGNNGTPTSYVGSAIGGSEPPNPGYEVPNAFGATTSVTFNVKDTHPGVTISQLLPGAAGDPAGPNKPSSFKITFDEAIDTASFDATDLDLATSTAAGAALGGFVPVTPGLVYSVPVLATDDGDITVTFSGTVYAAGHDGDATYANDTPAYDDDTIEWDQTGPTITIAPAPGQGDPTSFTPIVFEVTVGEALTTAAIELTPSDIDITGTAGATTAAVSQPDPLDFTTFLVSITGMGPTGEVTVEVGANAIFDTALNPNDASGTSTVHWEEPAVDNIPPTVTINQGVGQSDPTSDPTITYDVVFSEPVTGFATGDVTIAGTAGATSAAVSGGPTNYTVTASGMSTTGTVTLTIAAGKATDAALNPNDASTSTDNTVQWNQPAVDNIPPTVTINQGALQADPTSDPTITYDVVFSEPVTGFATGDVTIAGTAGATSAAVSGGPTNYTVTASGMSTTGTVTLTIAAGKATDAALNPNDASTSTDNTVQWNQPIGDITPPTVTINQGIGQSDPTSLPTIVFDVVFSEPVAGFATGDVTLAGTAGATTATVTGSGSTYSVSVAGMSTTGTVTASIAAGVATDAALNPNTASTSTDNMVQYSATMTISTPGGAVSISASGGTLTSFTSSSPQVPPPGNLSMPYGQLSFSATTTPNGLVTFTLVLPAAPIDYVKLVGSTWLSFTWNGETGAQINGNTVSITIRDNGRGDSNLAPGVATDPGAPVFAALVIPATGADSRTPVQLAALLMLAGMAAVFTGRRRGHAA